jgi:hypothetical protein
VVFLVVYPGSRCIVDRRSCARDGTDGAIKEIGYASVEPRNFSRRGTYSPRSVCLGYMWTTLCRRRTERLFLFKWKTPAPLRTRMLSVCLLLVN